jgi:imidazolonepropionase-like amidohydrolase
VPNPFALTDVTLVTGDAEGTVTPGRTVVVGPDATIEQVGSVADTVVPSEYRRIDLTGHFVLPGLINAHAHLFSDGRPVPPILLNESTAAIVTKLARSPLGRRLFKRRAKANALTQLHSGSPPSAPSATPTTGPCRWPTRSTAASTSVRGCWPPGRCWPSPAGTAPRRSR